LVLEKGKEMTAFCIWQYTDHAKFGNIQCFQHTDRARFGKIMTMQSSLPWTLVILPCDFTVVHNIEESAHRPVGGFMHRPIGSGEKIHVSIVLSHLASWSLTPYITNMRFACAF
jgi:hypothetical protein